MEQQMRQIVNDVFYDLEQASADCGEELTAEGLADFLGDRMYDDSAEYRALPWAERRALVLQVAQDYC